VQAVAAYVGDRLVAFVADHNDVTPFLFSFINKRFRFCNQIVVDSGFFPCLKLLAGAGISVKDYDNRRS
jgi:hypothetical protein